VDDDLPSGAEILAMHHPSQLFGASVGNGREVRRYWARLARAFRDTEPKVFQHARWLFERARDADDGTAASPDTVELPGTELAGVQTPQWRVQQWLVDQDYASLLSVLEHDPGAIPQQARMLHVLVAVVRGIGPDLTDAQMTAVRRELAHEGLALSPAEELTVRLAIAESNVVRRMRQDASVPQRFTDLVDAARNPDVSGIISAMNRLLEELSLPALRQVVAHVDVHHPGAWSVVERRMLWIRELGQAVEMDDQKASQLLAAYVGLKPPKPWLMFAGAFGFGVVVITAAKIVLSAVLGEVQGSTEDMEQVAAGLGGFAALSVGAIGYYFHLGRQRAFQRVRVGRILTVARGLGLLPSEAVEVIVRGLKSAVVARERYSMNDALIVFEADPNLLFECWGDTLAARFVAPPMESSS
jgi:hypothetical protein